MGTCVSQPDKHSLGNYVALPEPTITIRGTERFRKADAPRMEKIDPREDQRDSPKRKSPQARKPTGQVATEPPT